MTMHSELHKFRTLLRAQGVHVALEYFNGRFTPLHGRVQYTTVWLNTLI